MTQNQLDDKTTPFQGYFSQLTRHFPPWVHSLSPGSHGIHFSLSAVTNLPSIYSGLYDWRKKHVIKISLNQYF